MSWKPIETAPQDGPVMLQVGEDAAMAFQGGDGWYHLNIEDPSDLRYIPPDEIKGWRPIPTPDDIPALELELEQAQRKLQEVHAPLAAAIEQHDAIQRELAQIEAAEQAAQRKIEAEERAAQRKIAQREADEREQEAEQERLRQVRSLLPGGDA